MLLFCLASLLVLSLVEEISGYLQWGGTGRAGSIINKKERRKIRKIFLKKGQKRSNKEGKT